MRPWIFATALLAAAVPATAGEVINHVQGQAHDLDTGQLLYTEEHRQRVVDGEWTGGSTDYVFPDGTRFGRKTYDFTGDRFLPVYRLDLSVEGYREEIRANGAQVEMVRQRPGKKPEEKSVPKSGLVAADTGLPRLLVANWDALMAGDTIKFRIAAPSRLDSYKFKARRIADTTFEDRPAVQFQLDMDSMLNMFIGPIVFVFDTGERRIREFRGTTNVRNPATGEDYKVRITYPTKK